MFDVLETPSELVTDSPPEIAAEDAELLRRAGETKAFARDGYSSSTAGNSSTTGWTRSPPTIWQWNDTRFAS